MTPKSERGFALLAVMLVLALLSVVAVEFAFSMRLEASMVRAYKDGVIAAHLAEAGVQQGIREVLSDAQIQAVNEDGQVVFYRTAPGQTTLTKLPMLRRTRMPLGPGEISYRISDEEARLNLNAAPPQRVDQLLAALDVDKDVRDIIGASLQDWKDPNDEHRANGAESSDYYLKLPVPYRARNGPLQDAAELLQIRGVTPEIYRGKPDHPGLAEHVTVYGRGVVNMNTASRPVLRALGLSEAEVAVIMQTRVTTPYRFVDGRFGQRGLGVGSQTFRVEAEGFVAGEPRARIVAVVQRRPRQATVGGLLPGALAAASQGVSVQSWRVVETR